MLPLSRPHAVEMPQQHNGPPPLLLRPQFLNWRSVQASGFCSLEYLLPIVDSRGRNKPPMTEIPPDKDDEKHRMGTCRMGLGRLITHT